MKRLTLGPLPKLSGTIRLPGSKSLSNRYLLLAALSAGTTRLSNLLTSDDTRAMMAALRALGVGIREAGDERSLEIDGTGSHGFQVPADALDLGNAGTAMRPLAAVLCAFRGQFVLDGVQRMRERPIGDLVDGLRPILADGASVEYLEKTGFPPLAIWS